MQAIAGFFADLIYRLFSPKPWFFKVLQIAAAVLGAANVILNQLVSGGLVSGTNKVVGILTSGITFAVSITAIIMAQLPKKDTPPTA